MEKQFSKAKFKHIIENGKDLLILCNIIYRRRYTESGKHSDKTSNEVRCSEKDNMYHP
jgi:hypothetical protein